MHQARDYGINHIQARKDHKCYGMGLGVMILDEVYPGFPGDVRNASAFPFPVQYEIIRDVDMPKLIYAENKSACLESIQRAAQNLEQMGCRAIAAECGFFAYFQREIAASVNVPVFLSSLLQVPIAQQVVGPHKVIGIMGHAESGQYTEHLLASVGITSGSNYVICCSRDIDGSCEEFEHLWTPGKKTDPPGADFEKTEKEFLAFAIEAYRKYPNMGAMVLECTGMQPFARALQRKIDIPLFSWGTLLDYAYSVAVHREYYGHV